MTKKEIILQGIADGLDDDQILLDFETRGMTTTRNSIRWYRSKVAKGKAKKAKKAKRKTHVLTEVEPPKGPLKPLDLKADEKPTIELRSIKLHKGLSEETPAYTAKVFVNGEYFCNVSNSGHGGPDDYNHAKRPNKDLWAAIKELNAIIASTYPVINDYDIPLEHNLEMLCHQFVWDDDVRKLAKRKMGKNVYFYLKGEEDEALRYVQTSRSSKSFDLDHQREWVAKQYGDRAVIVNDMPLDEAMKLF